MHGTASLQPPIVPWIVLDSGVSSNFGFFEAPDDNPSSPPVLQPSQKDHSGQPTVN